MSGAVSRRDVLKALGAGSTIGLSIVLGAELATASHLDKRTELVENGPITLEYDDATIAEYQPQFVLDDVEPEPLAFHALHATHEESDLNAVYGFLKYPYQEGYSSADSHLGDHEPVIVFYEAASGDVVRVDYAAYHWFRGSAGAEAFQYADPETQRRPILRVDPKYHHYYVYTGNAAGSRPEREDLSTSIETWLESDRIEEKLALEQPWNPWGMAGRESWYKHTRENWVDAFLEALWFDLGLTGAAKTSDLEEVDTW